MGIGLFFIHKQPQAVDAEVISIFTPAVPLYILWACYVPGEEKEQLEDAREGILSGVEPVVAVQAIAIRDHSYNPVDYEPKRSISPDDLQYEYLVMDPFAGFRLLLASRLFKPESYGCWMLVNHDGPLESLYKRYNHWLEALRGEVLSDLTDGNTAST